MFKSAASVTQFQPDSVDIDLVQGVSLKPVTGIATALGGLISTGSDSLLYSDFDYSGVATRITAQVHVTRLGRVQDYVVQLWDGSKLIGTNLADPNAGDVHEYVFTGNYTVTPSFGLVLDLGPHRTIPSSTTVYIRSVGLKFE